MTVTDTTPRTRPFFLVMRPSRIHAGYCLVWCGEDRRDAPYGHPMAFASREEAVEAYPEWEPEIMAS